jgi:hypothetical protein
MPINTDFLYLGSTPCDEDCAQVGEEDYRTKATKEVNAYINQLNRMFPHSEENNVILTRKWSQHEFGSYVEVVVNYVIDNEKSAGYAIKIENNCPYNWDELAIEELGL